MPRPGPIRSGANRRSPSLGWGIGVAANAWDVFARKPITEEDIRRETERMQG